MLCQDCKKREATVHLTQINNKEKVSLALCSECANARGFHAPLDNHPFPLAEILAGMLTGPSSSKKEEPGTDLVCKSCGLTFEQFTRQGRFGCGDCYASFRPKLETIMRKIHGTSLHIGRSPEHVQYKGDDGAIPVREEERLEQELSKAISTEDFERAAELRDKLKQVRQKLEAEHSAK